MKFQPGDKVSYINEKLEGTIVSILGANAYKVEIEDGFTLDSFESELVLRQAFLKRAPTAEDSKKATSVPFEKPDLAKLFKVHSDFFLLVVPAAEQVLQGPVQWWLINNTKQEQLFACTIPEGRMETSIAHGLLGSNEAIMIKEFSRTTYTLSPSLLVRWIECKSENGKPPVYHTRQLETEFPALVQTHSTLSSPYCFARLHLLSEVILPDAAPEDLNALFAKFKPEEQISRDKQHSFPAAKIGSLKKDAEVYQRFGLSPSVNELDLHIEELIEDISSLTTTEMISIQLAAFQKALDRALITRQNDFVVIHGVGNGRLRAAIRKELSEQGLRFQDASFEKYGNGATRVILG